jgi:hypothetical protein
MRTLLACVLGPALTALAAHPQGGLAFQALPAEAPASLFDVALGSAEAELLVKGSWNIGASLQAGLVLDPSGSAGLADEQPFLFSQVPDLYLSFLLYKKLFVEVRVTQDISQAKYSIGYKGGEDDLLTELRIGNDGISFPSLPFLSLGAGSYRSFGAAASLAAGAFTGRAMLRYDQATRVVKTFVGGSEVTETVLEASAFVRGRWLVTPGVPVSNLEVYAASAEGSLAGGDGKTYRRLEASEYSYSQATGLISLAKAATTKVVAWYTGLATGTVLVDGSMCAILYDPDDKTAAGLASATLDLGRYAISASAGGEAYVRDRATGLKDTAYTVRIDSSGYAEVTFGNHTSPQDAESRQPFAPLSPGAAMPWLYSTDYSSTAVKDHLPAFSKEIVVLRYAASSKISIDSDVIEGSVEVLRNGVPDYAFTVDSGGGTLSLASPPGLDERIEVSYLRQSSDRSTGSLAAGLGGFFDLGGGLGAWTALGLRWSVPGTSYAEAGVSDPGSVILTAGQKYAHGGLAESLAVAGRWSTDVASGRYRLEGMEGAGSYALSFLPSDVVQFTAVETAESLLSSAFPNLEKGLHADGSAQKALKVTAVAAGPVSLDLDKYVDTVPVADLRVLSFMARGDSVAVGSTVTIQLDDGNGNPQLFVTIPGSALASSWRRFVLRYGYGSTTVSYQDEEDGILHAIASGSSGGHDPSVTVAKRLHIRIQGCDAGMVVWLDELLLEDAVGRAAFQAKGQLAYKDKAFSFSPGGFKLLSGIDASMDASGAVGDDSFVSGGASVATGLGPFDLKLTARASASADGLAMRGGHSFGLATASFPLSFTDSFDYDPATGGFGRSDKVGLDFGRAFSLKAEESTTWAGADASGTSLFSQQWKASTLVLAGILSGELVASSTSATSGFGGLEGGYFQEWLDAFNYVLPAFEGDFEKRSILAGMGLGLGAGKEVLKAKLSVTGAPAASGDYREEDASLRFQLPLAFGGSFLVTPYYQRAWTQKADGAGSGLLALGSLSFGDLAAASPLWNSHLVSELFSSSAHDGFVAYTSASLLGAASYTPEMGLALARESGSSWLDLLLPSSLSLSWKNQSLRADSTTSLTRILNLGLRFEAVNVFGSFGAYALTKAFETDEYQTSIQAVLKQAWDESLVRSTFIIQNLATLYAADSRDSLAVDNRFSWAQEASSTVWSESLKLTLSELSQRSWLLDLYRLAVRGPNTDKPVDGKAEEESAASGTGPGGKPKVTIVSSWLTDLAGSPVVARTIYGLSLTFGSKASDAAAASLALDAEESVEFKVTVPQKLSLSVKPAANQTRDAETSVLQFGLSLSVSGTVSF